MSDRGTKTGLYPLALCSAAFSSAYAAKMSSPGGPEVDQESPERLAVVLYALATGWRCKNASIADSGKRERRGISRRRRAGSARTSYIQVVREESASGETLTAGPLDVVQQEQEDVEGDEAGGGAGRPHPRGDDEGEDREGRDEGRGSCDSSKAAGLSADANGAVNVLGTAGRSARLKRCPPTKTTESMPTKVASAVTSEDVSGDATRSALLHLDAH
ncbi:hypothetical protein PHYSODRAFT_338209 [Phytophthora sojae]|uniref:Uncharacterized protein n=1 Tax=Phytophthora sojae (strain P6497) TaxID=1094619 RepID=G5A3L7_PHYSP|nr:hypothetical protein PHYSODRAFT_338209 [Phytophthora sojae]EGZ09390.1 hypothetical protein PHYSODRAFT_338209 [Phytophthora sojae]|eukprot:XP_009534251.1 hypothetical protein PHYSODRAFT_338209 [Phytophthora sojae]